MATQRSVFLQWSQNFEADAKSDHIARVSREDYHVEAIGQNGLAGIDHVTCAAKSTSLAYGPSVAKWVDRHSLQEHCQGYLLCGPLPCLGQYRLVGRGHHTFGDHSLNKSLDNFALRRIVERNEHPSVKNHRLDQISSVLALASALGSPHSSAAQATKSLRASSWASRCANRFMDRTGLEPSTAFSEGRLRRGFWRRM